jgi:hypothetical protein
VTEAGTHRCPVAGCSTKVSNDKLMCLPHWRQVPLSMQRDIVRSCRRSMTAVTVSEEYRHTVRTAVAYVEATEPWNTEGMGGASQNK